MQNKKNNIIKKYLREIKKELTAPRPLKHVFIHELKDSIDNSLKEKDNITLDDLYSEFGNPKEISDSFYNRSDYQALLKKAKRHTIIWMVIGICAFALFLIAVTIIIALIDQYGGTINITDVYQNT